MQKKLLKRGLHFAFLLMMFVFTTTSNASNLIGDQIEIAVNPENEMNPRIAFNQIHNEYLVVWWNDREGCDDIRAQRITASGELLGPPFYVAAECPSERRYPDVAYNAMHDEYLVVWEHNGNSIRARRVSADGILIGLNEIEIITSSVGIPWSKKPVVDYAYTSDTYLVVWEVTLGTLPVEYAIYGQLLDHNGLLLDSTIPISRGEALRESSDLAYNRHANRFLVVWQQFDSNASLWDIYGQQIRGNGELHQEDLLIAFYSASSTHPAVAAIPTSPTDIKFLVAWDLFNSTDYDIYAKTISEEGDIISNTIVLANSSDWEALPVIAGSEGNLSYLVTWANPNLPGIWARTVSYDGFKLSQIMDLSESSDAPANGDIAAGKTADFLAVWSDFSDTSEEIYGRLLGLRIFLPVITR